MDLDLLPWSRYIQLHRFIPSQQGDLVKIRLVASNTLIDVEPYKVADTFVSSALLSVRFQLGSDDGSVILQLCMRAFILCMWIYALRV